MQGSFNSSLSIWTAFDNKTTAFTRELAYQLAISWKRAEDADAGFAVVGTSVVGGTDIVKGDTEAVTSADTFEYFDETEKLINLGYDRELIEPLGGIAMALMDIELDNTDQRFTPNKNATIGTAILPDRPINSHIGFVVKSENKTVPIFKGLTKMPKEDKLRRTAEITSFDFVRFLFRAELDSKKYTDQRSDQIIEDILTTVGFGSSQYELDTGLNTISFAFFSPGDTAGVRIKKVCEAEEGFFYQDEGGILRFENRNHNDNSPHDTPVWDIDKDDIIDWEQEQTTDIINKVTVKAKPRAVQSLQEIWDYAGVPEAINASETITIWASLDDPADSITTPAENTDYEANTQSDGGGTDISADISITITKFVKAAELEITNNNASNGFITLLKLRGQPATVTGEILEIVEDTTSQDKYDLQERVIENDFIDSKSFAETLAQGLIDRYADPRKRIKITVQGIPHLQLRDLVRVEDLDLDTYKNYRVMRIKGILDSGGFTQDLWLREVTGSVGL